MKTALALTLLLTLSGCAFNEFREGWTKHGMNAQNLKVDLYLCERDMWLTDMGHVFFRRCMQARGYSK